MCVCVTLIIQHAKRAVARLAQHYFPQCNIKQNFREKFIKHTTCGLIFSTNMYENFLILSNIQA
jgi:hypothetical protein